MSRPGSALPNFSPEDFERFLEEQRKDPKYIQNLLDRAKTEFDANWGIDPDSPTDYESHPGVTI